MDLSPAGLVSRKPMHSLKNIPIIHQRIKLNQDMETCLIITLRITNNENVFFVNVTSLKVSE